MTAALARFCSGRVHYAWVALVVAFTVTLGAVGVRAAPGVMIVPLQQSFGWSVGTISAAISLNILLLGMTGPFITGLMETFGLRRTILSCLGLLLVGTALSTFITQSWQLFFTWGLLVGVGASAGAVGMAAAVANRWFVSHRGLAMGLLSSSQRRRAADLPADPRAAVAELRLAERVDHGVAEHRRADPARRTVAAGNPPPPSVSRHWAPPASRCRRCAAATRSGWQSTG